MRSNKLKSYFIIFISVLLSTIVTYYLSTYISNPIGLIFLASTLAIILVRLFELSLSQLNQNTEAIDDSIYSPITAKAIEQFQQQLKQHDTTAQLFILHWPTKQYVLWNGGESFSAQHSLVYVLKDNSQIIDIKNSQYFSKLPEVVALDIQVLLKQYNANHALALYSNQDIFGFVLLNLQSDKLDHEMLELTKKSSQTVGQLLQHDAIIGGVSNLKTDSPDVHYIQLTWQSKVVLVWFIALTCWWLATPFVTSIIGHRYTFDFGDLYGVIAVWGSIWSLIVAKQFRKQKNMSRAFFMFGLGLLSQEFGQLSYAVWDRLWHMPIPYPSMGDIGYFGSVIFYLLGVIFLARAAGINLKLRNFKNKLLAVLVPALMLLLGYLLFLQNYTFDWNDPVRIFLDFGYPFFQATYVSIAILIYLLTFNTKGYAKNQMIFIVLALIWQFICDYTFLFQASRGTWEVNGLNDYMYLISYILLSLTILQFKDMAPIKQVKN